MGHEPRLIGKQGPGIFFKDLDYILYNPYCNMPRVCRVMASPDPLSFAEVESRLRDDVCATPGIPMLMPGMPCGPSGLRPLTTLHDQNFPPVLEVI